MSKAKNKFVSSIWDLRQRTLGHIPEIHNFFRFLGKLPPLLVRRLINLYSHKNDLILTNFAGCGTVLVEARVAGRRSIGVDSNPLFHLLCKTKTTPFVPDTKEFLLKLRKRLSNRESNLLFNYPKGEKWFHKESLVDLQNILDEIQTLEDEKERNFYRVAVANIIKVASKIDSRCVNHIVLDENKPKINVSQRFSLSVGKLKNALEEFRRYDQGTQTDVHLGDARNLDFVDDNSVDLIISHPPYLGAILYYNIYQLENDLLGFDHEEIKYVDISTYSLEKYLRNMKKVFDEIYRVLKPKKYACVVIGDTRRNGDIIPTFSHFIDYGTEIGFRLRDIFIWVLIAKAGMNVARRGNYIDHNYILIFQKK